MSFARRMKLARFLPSAVSAVLLCLSSVAAAQEVGVYFALTNTGQILSTSSSGNRWRAIETDSTTRFIHAARYTLYKVSTGGHVQARNWVPGRGIVPEHPWKSLLADYRITSRAQLTGGDDLLNGGYRNTADRYDSSLYKLVDGSIREWDGINWVRRLEAIGINGDLKLVAGGTEGNLQSIGRRTWVDYFAIAGRFVHRGGKRFDNYFYTQYTGAGSPWNLMTATPDGAAPQLVWTINGAGNGEFLGKWSQDGPVLYSGWGNENDGHPDDDKQEDVWKFSADTWAWTFVKRSYIRSLAAANGGDEVAILYDDGRGSVQIFTCYDGAACTAKAVLASPAGQTVTQIVSMTVDERE